MINGLQVDVKSAELKSIIKSRIEYHTEKAEAYSKQALKLKQTIMNIEEDVSHGKVSNGQDVSQGMEGKAREHKDKAIHFQFLLDHVILDDVYRLGPQDLQLLGIAQRGYY